jgi:hypothetical protein
MIQVEEQVKVFHVIQVRAAKLGSVPV